MYKFLKGKADFRTIVIAFIVVHLAMMMLHIEKIKKEDLSSHQKIIRINFNPTLPESLKKIKTKQIVQSEDTDSKKESKDSEFLSDKTRSFDRQVISRNNNSFQTSPKKTKTPPSESKKNLKFSDLAVAPGSLDANKFRRAPASEQSPHMDVEQDMNKGVSSTNDYVKEVKLGDFTHLNTTEYKHYGFFHRIRQKLEQFWGRSIQEKASQLFRNGRRLPASDNLITSLQVTLNSKGEIIKVRILGTSGVKELDDVAIESFNQAGPFPNPPKDLLVNGIAIIEWGFVVKS